jgi:antitoxin YefM
MIPVNEAQHQLQDLIDAVNQSHQPMTIAGQHGNAVLLATTDWASIQETLYLLSIPGMRESIREGMATPIEDCDRLGAIEDCDRDVTKSVWASRS